METQEDLICPLSTAAAIEDTIARVYEKAGDSNYHK